MVEVELPNMDLAMTKQQSDPSSLVTELPKVVAKQPVVETKPPVAGEQPVEKQVVAEEIVTEQPITL